MGSLTLQGLVLRAADYKESSKMLTVLTDSRGKIAVSAKGAARPKSRVSAACRLFAFSEMTLTESRERYYLNEAATIALFSGLAARLEHYALGCYFLELLEAACPENAEEPEALALGLNALWLLDEGKKELPLVKSAFELRLMSLLGYRPELERCPVCGAAEPERPYLDLRGGAVCCGACAAKSAARAPLEAGSLAAMRHIVGAEPGRVFSFALKAGGMKSLANAAEGYVREQLERRFRTLEYYNSL